MLYSHVKNHLCYGYIINRTFHTKKLLKGNGLVFHWCLYNKWNITWPLGDTKNLFECFNTETLEEKFRISVQPCNMHYLFWTLFVAVSKFTVFTVFDLS